MTTLYEEGGKLECNLEMVDQSCPLEPGELPLANDSFETSLFTYTYTGFFSLHLNSISLLPKDLTHPPNL